jgi:hypothetical protein
VAAISPLLANEGRLVISHPMGKGFVKELSRGNKALHIEELRDRVTLDSLLESHGLRLVAFADERNLYIAIAEKS